MRVARARDERQILQRCECYQASTDALHMCARRLHLRKCQCREKTPPCKNCPKCKEVGEITAQADPEQQQAVCKTQLQCDICACKCGSPQISPRYLPE